MMKCVNEKCEQKVYCEKAHLLNRTELGKDQTIIIPNKFFVEANLNNRLVKWGIPSEGFEFGCMKLVESKKQNDTFILYINDKCMTEFQLSELVEICNSSFSEMVNNGEIKLR